MPAPHATVIRITTLQARPDVRAELVAAAWENAAAAGRQDGCLSAEVAADPGDADRILVISRWESEQAVADFLRWHEQIAHAGLRDFTARPPASVHHTVDAGAAFAADWAAWHAEHERVRADPHGFLAITAAHWLGADPQRFDDAPGAWSTTDAAPVVTLVDGETLHIDGREVTGRHDFGAIESGRPQWVSWQTDAGTAVAEVANFGGAAVLRPRHPDHPTLVDYAGTPAYAPDEQFVVEGTFVPFPAPRTVTVDTVVDGLETVFEAPGVVRFELDGPQQLTAFRDGAGLRLLFTDRTSGVTTYPASRDLHIGAPDAAGRVQVDFTRAVNLPCAYTTAAMCPLPPTENRLDVAIEAGEQLP
ncbi:hypothetical protein GCM10022240_03060 [Microbacterium kribbense]|uniref:ABM domain-containing protein n=1 Tax=Microbacterium kribbense TaxID=433645 RepID=A0ABP7G0Z5_9MICO